MCGVCIKNTIFVLVFCESGKTGWPNTQHAKIVYAFVFCRCVAPMGATEAVKTKIEE